MPDSPKVFLLGEDQCHLRFMYGWLIRHGLRRHHVRELPIAAGRGSGAQRVQEVLPGEIAAIRSRSANTSCWLIVMTDADTSTVEERLRTLERPHPGDPVTIIIPRRNVETWVKALNEDLDVDEVTDYGERHQDWTACRKAGEILARPERSPQAWPPSLVRAHSQLKSVVNAPGILRNL